MFFCVCKALYILIRAERSTTLVQKDDKFMYRSFVRQEDQILYYSLHMRSNQTNCQGHQAPKSQMVTRQPKKQDHSSTYFGTHVKELGRVDCSLAVRRRRQSYVKTLPLLASKMLAWHVHFGFSPKGQKPGAQRPSKTVSIRATERLVLSFVRS
jgi:hypothetical protein